MIVETIAFALLTARDPAPQHLPSPLPLSRASCDAALTLPSPGGRGTLFLPERGFYSLLPPGEGSGMREQPCWLTVIC
jgi:hypothetical protein